jgi:hypothetical protein
LDCVLRVRSQTRHRFLNLFLSQRDSINIILIFFKKNQHKNIITFYYYLNKKNENNLYTYVAQKTPFVPTIHHLPPQHGTQYQNKTKAPDYLRKENII